MRGAKINPGSTQTQFFWSFLILAIYKIHIDISKNSGLAQIAHAGAFTKCVRLYIRSLIIPN